MPPTLEKLKGHIALGSSVHPSVCPFKIDQDTVLKFHIRIPHQKIIDLYFFKVWIISLCEVLPLIKAHNDILKSRYLKNYNRYELQTWSANRGY